MNQKKLQRLYREKKKMQMHWRGGRNGPRAHFVQFNAFIPALWAGLFITGCIGLIWLRGQDLNL